MPQPKNTMGSHAWSMYEEKVCSLPDGIFDIGVGHNLSKECGMSSQTVATLVSQVATQLFPRDGFYLIDLSGNNGIVKAFCRRRGKSLDLGNEADAKDIGWDEVFRLAQEKEKGL